MVRDERPELGVGPELPTARAHSSAASPTPGPVRVIGASRRVTVAPDLPADRVRRATESGGDGTDAEAPDQLVRDRDPLGLRQVPCRHRASGTGDRRVGPHLAGAGRDRPAVPPAVTGLAVDPDDARRRGVAHALSHQGTVLVALARQRLGSGRLPGPVMRRHWQLLNGSGVATTAGMPPPAARRIRGHCRGGRPVAHRRRRPHDDRPCRLQRPRRGAIQGRRDGFVVTGHCRRLGRIRGPRTIGAGVTDASGPGRERVSGRVRPEIQRRVSTWRSRSSWS